MVRYLVLNLCIKFTKPIFLHPVDPDGTLWFSNVTLDDMSEGFLYACSAASYFRNEYKLGNRVHLRVVPGTIRYVFCQFKWVFESIYNPYTYL